MIGSGLEATGLESRVTSWAASAIRTRRGGRWKITQSMYRQMPEQSGGGCSGICRVRYPGSGTFRIRLGSPRTTRPRLRRHLAARTGAVQVDVGVAGAVHAHARGAPALLAVTAPAHRCTGAPSSSGQSEPGQAPVALSGGAD
jgi:hypothetical protein